MYNDFKNGPVNEKSSIFQHEIKGDKVTGETYGPLKVMCEKLIEESIKDKALIIRPGIVIGPFDPTDRFTYWAMKLNSKETVLVPGSKKRIVQWIDARDLAAFTISQLERKVTGVFNVVADPVSMEEFVLQTTCGEPQTVWADEQYLLEEGIQAFELPFWMPYSEDYPEGFILAANEKAKSRGLASRPLNQSAQDTLEWVEKEENFQLKTGISREKERSLLGKIEK